MVPVTLGAAPDTVQEVGREEEGRGGTAGGERGGSVGVYVCVGLFGEGGRGDGRVWEGEGG